MFGRKIYAKRKEWIFLHANERALTLTYRQLRMRNVSIRLERHLLRAFFCLLSSRVVSFCGEAWKSHHRNEWLWREQASQATLAIGQVVVALSLQQYNMWPMKLYQLVHTSLNHWWRWNCDAVVPFAVCFVFLLLFAFCFLLFSQNNHKYNCESIVLWLAAWQEILFSSLWGAILCCCCCCWCLIPCENISTASISFHFNFISFSWLLGIISTQLNKHSFLYSTKKQKMTDHHS